MALFTVKKHYSDDLKALVRAFNEVGTLNEKKAGMPAVYKTVANIMLINAVSFDPATKTVQREDLLLAFNNIVSDLCGSYDNLNAANKAKLITDQQYNAIKQTRASGMAFIAKAEEDGGMGYEIKLSSAAKNKAEQREKAGRKAAPQIKAHAVANGISLEEAAAALLTEKAITSDGKTYGLKAIKQARADAEKALMDSIKEKIALADDAQLKRWAASVNKWK